MVTYTVPFLVEHEGSNGMTSVSTITGLTANSDGCLANAELVLVSVPLATLVQTSLGLYRSPTGPGR